MRGTLLTLAAVLAATFVVAPFAQGEEPQTREGYVARVEPLCKVNTEASQRVLSGVGHLLKQRKLKPAGRDFVHASRIFARGIGQIAKVPRPPADEARLLKWFRYLRIVKGRMFKLGQYLKAEERLRATHEKIALEHSSNAANNVGFVFRFHYCKLSRERFGE
jgi:hypothetical protein